MDNQLQVIVKESGLEQTKAQFILEKFQNYFELASEWEIKAKTIVVTDASQKAEMEMARAGRLFLKEKRVMVEKARKELKEQALREGKAIDGIANVLKALIVPIEEYLEHQEKFVELKLAAEAEAKRLEVEKRIEEERIAKEKAEAEERERIRIENERLKAEAIQRQKEADEIREKQAAVIAEQQRQIEAEKKRLAKVEAEAKAKELAELKAKQEAEAREKALKAQEEKRIANKKHRDKIEGEIRTVLKDYLPEKDANEIVDALKENRIPHVVIQY